MKTPNPKCHAPNPNQAKPLFPSMNAMNSVPQQEQEQEQDQDQDQEQEQQPITAEKKTRDMPNLSECHSCGFRIDTSSGKNNRLQPLYSEWRVVLLCRKCIFQVESSIICSYCFKQSSTNNSLHCSQCDHIVHKTCYSEHSTMPPWSYFSSPCSQSWVCVDCWVPKSIAVRRELRARRRKRKKNNKCLVNVVRDANCGVEKKVELASKARELAVAKALVARRAAELARGALDFVADCGRMDSNDDEGNELALWLNQAVNGATGILKGFSSVNSSCLTFGRTVDNNGRTFSNPGVCRKLECSPGKLASYPLVYTRMKHRPAVYPLVYTRMRRKAKDRKKLAFYPLVYTRMRRNAIGGNVNLHMEGAGSCSNKLINLTGDDNESQSCRDGDEFTAAEDDISNGNHDRYLIKYSRRKLNERQFFSNWPRLLYDSLQHETQPAEAELLFHCSKESVTFSGSSLQSCTFSLQACASSSGFSQG